MILLDPTQELKTRRARHIEVADHLVESLCCQYRKRLGTAETNSNGNRCSQSFAEPIGKCCHKISVTVS